MAVIKKRGALVIGALLTVAGLLGYHLLWGRLFPASPLILGFARRELSHLVVYVQDANSTPHWDWVDSLVSEVEAFHGLRFTSKPRLFFFTDSDSYVRRSGGRTRVRAFYNGAVVISPWIQREDAEGRLSLRIYIQHELSHSLLFQNMSLWACLRYPEWLLEGIATYSAKQTGTFLYPSKAQTFELIRQGHWTPPALFGTGEGLLAHDRRANPRGCANSPARRAPRNTSARSRAPSRCSRPRPCACAGAGTVLPSRSTSSPEIRSAPCEPSSPC